GRRPSVGPGILCQRGDCRGGIYFSLVRVAVEELTQDDVGIETDGVRVGANVCPAVNSRGPLRDVIALERFEQRALDFALLGDRAEGDALFLTVMAQTGAETFMHAGTPPRKHETSDHWSRWDV